VERAVSRLAGYQKVPLGFQLTCDFIGEISAQVYRFFIVWGE